MTIMLIPNSNYVKILNSIIYNEIINTKTLKHAIIELSRMIIASALSKYLITY